MGISCKRFRVASFFPGGKRDFVEKVARILADRFEEKAILYDKYHEAEFPQCALAKAQATLRECEEALRG